MTRRHFTMLLNGSVLPLTQALFAEPHAPQVVVLRFDRSGKEQGFVKVDKVVLNEAEWRKRLSTRQFRIARKADTEVPYTGDNWNNHAKGLYRCVCCENALFLSETKFESGTGWPSFWKPVAKENLETVLDYSFGVRNEVKCRRCDAHLGHVFNDGPPPTGLRYCMNGAVLKFEKSERATEIGST